MLAVAVGGRALHVQPQPGACGHRPAPGRRSAPQPVGAGQAFGAGFGNRRRRLAENRHHAAAGIAVKHRKRAAQHLDAFGGRQQEVGNLALAVGHRRRDAVGVQAHPAHAKTRARAEAADRQLHVLGLVLAFAHHHAGNPRQGFGQRKRGAATAQVAGVEHADRRRHVQPRQRLARGGDDQRLKLHRRFLSTNARRGAQPRQRGQQQPAQGVGHSCERSGMIAVSMNFSVQGRSLHFWWS